MHIVKVMDFWAGLVLGIIGACAFLTALGFDEESSGYPAALSLTLLLLSLALIVKAGKETANKAISAEEAHMLLSGPILEISVWSLWALALWAGLGYIGPAFVAVAFLIFRHTTDRRPGLHLAQAAAVSIGVFAIFFLIFKVPLPELDAIMNLLD